uniref:Uncharacterized protein n=1 Tax=Rhodnius prolixus TaxID=13249 RepID=T1IG21_RHOPR
MEYSDSDSNIEAKGTHKLIRVELHVYIYYGSSRIFQFICCTIRNRRRTMKFLYSALLFVICTVSADEAAFKLKGKPQKALLIFPPPLTVQNETTTESVQNETERADNVTDSVLERFKQLQGSITNVYYISLPDGKLEKLEYIRAPSGLLQETQESQSKDPVSTNYQPTFNQYRQSSAPTASNKLQGNQQTNHQIVFGTNKHSNQANQQQYNQVPQQFRVSNQLSSQFSSQ